MDIYNTKKQTENIPESCSYLLLKTLFYFISQCTSVPYLERVRSPTTAMLHLFSQEIDLKIKVIMNCVNIKLWDILGCFHYILNPPCNGQNEYVQYKKRTKRWLNDHRMNSPYSSRTLFYLAGS